MPTLVVFVNVNLDGSSAGLEFLYATAALVGLLVGLLGRRK